MNQPTSEAARPTPHRCAMTIGSREILLETGRIARQAHGAVLVRLDDTVVLVTVVAANEPNDRLGFFPLTVEYREKYAATGRLPGGFIKREGRISEHEILTSRLIDRSIRPLFPKAYRCETQVVAAVLSAEPDAEPAPLAILGASAALHLSEIPWHGPAAGLRIARLGGQLRLLPKMAERQGADLDLVVSSAPSGLTMVEGGAREIPEEEVLEALFAADDAMRPIRETLDGWRETLGRPKRSLDEPRLDEALRDEAAARLRAGFSEILEQPTKAARRQALATLETQILADLAGEDPLRIDQVKKLLEKAHADLVRRRIVETGRRLDGRGPSDIRPVTCEVGWLPRTHGSALFTRGETQAMVTCTLAPTEEGQRINSVFGDSRQNFLLHYNFPPYSVGEVRPLRGPGRREIGHGNLARRALEALVPGIEEFPYTIRVESDISESNGSSSMATTCGACLALMDAGVPITKPIAGIAMGLIQEGDRHVVLTDILGDEDHLGDMDFKVTGTADGITALQMDNKVGGLGRAVLEGAMRQALEGRRHILEVMSATLAAPRETLSPHAPRMSWIRIRPGRLGELIGPRGQTIQRIQEETGARITVDDSGLVCIFTQDASGAREARRRVRQLVGEPKVGRLYRGQVVSVKDFGLFVRILGGSDGLVHVSELGPGRIDHPDKVARQGDEIVVRLVGVDNQGRLQLSRTQALDSQGEDIDE